METCFSGRRGRWWVILPAGIIAASILFFFLLWGVVMLDGSFFPVFPWTAKRRDVWINMQSLATAVSSGTSFNYSLGGFASHAPPPLPPAAGRSWNPVILHIGTGIISPLNSSGANSALHARPAGVNLTGAARVDLPPAAPAAFWLPEWPKGWSHPPATALCSRSGPDHWQKCRTAIWEKLGFGGMTCPEKCVTFGRYGRYNNNIIQLALTIISFLDPVMIGAASRRSVVLDGWCKKPQTLNPRS